MTVRLTSFLYHVTVGKGDPFEKQLTLSVSLILGTGTEDGGVEENTGSTKKVKQLFSLVFCNT